MEYYYVSTTIYYNDDNKNRFFVTLYFHYSDRTEKFDIICNQITNSYDFTKSDIINLKDAIVENTSFSIKNINHNNRVFTIDNHSVIPNNGLIKELKNIILYFDPSYFNIRFNKLK